MIQWVAWMITMSAILLSSGSALMVSGGYVDRFSAIMAASGVALLTAALMMIGQIHTLA